jgi:hypothetical protein
MTRFTLALRASVAIAAVFLAAAPVSAWHEQGHKDVGAVAEHLLANHPHALAQVRAILGSVTLEQAGPWGDCVREVRGPTDFPYRGNPRQGSVCRGFADNSTLRDQMRHYVRNNWGQCPHTGKGCHTQYHFVDLAIQRTRYEEGPVGTHPWDLVHGINTAATVLSRPACDGPNPSTEPVANPSHFRPNRPGFSFTCAEALMMLVHFVGDLHQPMHVGGVYLDQNGTPVDPDSSAAERARERQTSTHGANSLHFTESPNSGELHGHWDETSPQNYTNAELAHVPATPGNPGTWAATWATDSLALAGQALRPLSFSQRHDIPHDGALWVVSVAQCSDPVEHDPRHCYDKHMREAQHDQIAKAGVRLAEILVSIWP